MSDATKEGIGGVQQLLTRIRDEGVGAARKEAERILAQAREEAATMRAKARSEANTIIEHARNQVNIEQQSGKEALRLAARDTLLELRATVRRDFEEFVRHLVTRQTRDVGFLRDLIMVVAGQSAERFVNTKRAQIFVDKDLLGAKAAEGLEDTALGAELSSRTLELSAEMLREGIELIPSHGPSGGARVRLVDEKLELDLSDEAISRMLLRFLLPRFRHIIEEQSSA